MSGIFFRSNHHTRSISMFCFEITQGPFTNGIQIRLRLTGLAILNIFHKPRDSDSRENTDDGDDDHEFDEGKAFAREARRGDDRICQLTHI